MIVAPSLCAIARAGARAAAAAKVVLALGVDFASCTDFASQKDALVTRNFTPQLFLSCRRRNWSVTRVWPCSLMMLDGVKLDNAVR